MRAGRYTKKMGSYGIVARGRRLGRRLALGHVTSGVTLGDDLPSARMLVAFGPGIRQPVPGGPEAVELQVVAGMSVGCRIPGRRSPLFNSVRVGLGIGDMQYIEICGCD